jgi:RsiW-degrading membrane proteinase PrsW (M82 family)
MADVSPGGMPDQAAPPTSGPAAPIPALPQAGYLAPPDTPQDGSPGTTMLLAGGRKTGWRRWLPIAGVITFLLAASIGMLLFLGVDMGPTALAIGLTAAVIPVPLLVASFLWLDRYEPEPIRYLAFCFAWGAAIATAVALVVNTSAAWLFAKLDLPDELVAVLVAPFIEESMKALGPLLLFWRRRAEWSGITDGIVYCGLSALGFAMVENVLYLGKHGYAAGAEEYGPASGLTNVFAIFILRILFTGFAHPLFSSMTGIGLGIAARSGDRRVRWLAPIAGLLLAMILHGTFNLLPTLSASLAEPLILLYGYLGFMVPFFFAVVGFAVALRSWEGRLTERVLPFYVRAGWFSPPEVAALGSLGRRHSARQWAKRVAGAGGQRAMKSFQFAATQLALLRDGMQRGLNHKPEDLHRAAAEEQRLLSSLVEYRSAFVGRDPQTPQAFWDGESYQIAFPDGVMRTVSAPDEPVVPVPVRYAPPPVYAYGGYPPGPGYGAPAYHAPAGSPGGSPYGAAGPAIRPPAPGYGPPSYGGGQPGYGGGQPGYGGGQPGYGGSQPGYGGYDPQAGYGPQPGYGAPPVSGAHPGYGSPVSGAQPSSGAQPGYGVPPGPGAQSGYGVLSGSGGQPGYGAQPGNGFPPGYSAAQGTAAVPAQPTTPFTNYPPAPGYPAPPPFAPVPTTPADAPGPEPAPGQNAPEDPPAR